MLKSSRRVPLEKVVGACIVRLPLSIGEFVRVLNVIILWPNFFQIILSVYTNAMIINKKGDMQSPCLTPNFFPISDLAFPILITIFRSAYIRAMAWRCLGGAPYLYRIFSILLWLTVSNSLTTSTNATYGIGSLERDTRAESETSQTFEKSVFWWSYDGNK